jgi:hypothetical protein
LMDSKYIWYTNVSWKDAGFFNFYFLFLKGRGLHFHTSSTSSELLKRFQWILVGMEYLWSPTSVVVFQNNLHIKSLWQAYYVPFVVPLFITAISRYIVTMSIHLWNDLYLFLYIYTCIQRLIFCSHHIYFKIISTV